MSYVIRESVLMQWGCVGSHLLTLLSGIILSVGNIVVRDLVEHIGHCSAWSNSIDRNFLVATIF